LLDLTDELLLVLRLEIARRKPGFIDEDKNINEKNFEDEEMKK
jgi:hypothetical protein